jgi:radical SAM superfamily enzyme YgiQ (UPF0313 family)
LRTDYAVWGEGEEALVLLAEAVRRRKAPDGVPGLVRRVGDRTVSTPPRNLDLAARPAPRRTFVDNLRYLREGAQVGFETSRGCGCGCAYCADPLLKGAGVRTRAPETVAKELESLVRAGVTVFHTCDSEFNVSPRHALAVCEAISARGLGSRLRWYAYCAPVPFSAELAKAMGRAGCAGVNFGVDHTDGAMLKRLGRRHSLADIAAARKACANAGLAVMFDLLLGGPGETRATIRSALAALAALKPEAAGLALGIRLYRGTPLGDELAPSGGPARLGVTSAGDDLLLPAFFLEPGLGSDVAVWLADLARNHPHFFFLGAAGMTSVHGDRSNYNYNANVELEKAIARGARGAYWDILRQQPKKRSRG